MTNNKGLDRSYLSHRLSRWEDVYPFATGWSPRPGDAAWLMRRFRHIRKALKREGALQSLQDVANDKVFPFFFVRVCAFGRNSDGREYCVSQVKQAYGCSDALRVFGFAVAQGFGFAMALLNKDQASLTTGTRGEPARNVVAATWASSGLWEQACVVGLANHTPENAHGSEQHILRQVGDRVTLAATTVPWLQGTRCCLLSCPPGKLRVGRNFAGGVLLDSTCSAARTHQRRQSPGGQCYGAAGSCLHWILPAICHCEKLGSLVENARNAGKAVAVRLP